jgi:hypothetical protein
LRLTRRHRPTAAQYARGRWRFAAESARAPRWLPRRRRRAAPCRRRGHSNARRASERRLRHDRALTQCASAIVGSICNARSAAARQSWPGLSKSKQ